MNTTVPVPRLNVPLLVKFPETFKVAGAFSVPALMVIFAKFVVNPEILVVPLNTIVPALALKVPLFVQLPATFKLPDGAVSVLVLPIVRLLNEHALVPEIVVVPPKVTVPKLAVSVPLFIRFPFTLKFEEGVSVPVFDTVTAPNVGVVLPLRVVVPENVTVLAVSTEVELLTKLPLMSRVLALLSKVPALKVRIPATIVLPSSVFVFVPAIVTLLNVCAPGVID